MIKQQIELMVLEDLKKWVPELSDTVDQFIEERFDADNNKELKLYGGVK